MPTTSKHPLKQMRYSYLAIAIAALMSLYYFVSNMSQENPVDLHKSRQNTNAVTSPNISSAHSTPAVVTTAATTATTQGTPLASRQPDPFKAFLITHKKLHPTPSNEAPIQQIPQTQTEIHDKFKEAVDKQMAASTLLPFPAAPHEHGVGGSKSSNHEPHQE